jgi:hypothetical protein
MNALVDDLTALRSHVGERIGTAARGHAIHLANAEA